MYMTLRIVRGIAGLFFVYQLVGLLPVLTWLQNPAAVNSGMWVVVIVKLVMAALGVGVFIGAKRLANYLHMKKHGVPHPVYAGKTSAL